jgi:hypothetical protein
MQYISIGVSCNVKYQIDKYKGNKATLFFDYLLSNMCSVIKLLECEDINKILNKNSIVLHKKNPVKNNNSRIVIKSLASCESIHDLPINFNNEDINNFIDKYKRRYYRIINYINSGEKILFLRYNKITLDEKNRFVNAVLKINPDCNFSLVNIYTVKPSQIKCKREMCTYFRHTNKGNNGGSHCCNACKLSGTHGPLCGGSYATKRSIGISKSKYCLDLKLINPKPKVDYWTTDYLDWKNIFKSIEKNL